MFVAQDNFAASYNPAPSKTLQEIEESANNGCGFCKYLYGRFIQDSPKEKIDPKLVLHLEYTHYYSHWRFLVQIGSTKTVLKVDSYENIIPSYIRRDGKREAWEYDNISMSVQQRESDAVKEFKDNLSAWKHIYFHTPQQSVVIATIAQLILARTWFFRCTQGHDQCDRSRNRQFYPMRLIDVRGDSPRLVISAEERDGLSGPYATLSHRWSSLSKKFTLTTEILSQFRNSIPTEQISPTLRDAINVCKALEVPYIWMDTMCIVQSGPGSYEDWQNNGSALASIYTNSIVNLAAEIDDVGGFIHSTIDAKIKVPSRFIVSNHKEYIAYPASMSKNISRPLDKRGWIIQEMLLAPRVLRFGLGQMSWECMQNPCASEAFPAGVETDSTILAPNVVISPHGSNHLKLKELRNEILRLEDAQRNHECSQPTSFSTKKLQLCWLDLIEVYSQCDLTYPDKDKLMAISGIARRVGGVMKSDYVAGLFHNMLPRALLWSVEEPGTFLKEGVHNDGMTGSKAEYRAPTWSWASLDKSIDFLIHRIRADSPVLAEILNTSVVLSDDANPFGQILQANIIVRSSIIRLQRSANSTGLTLDPERYKHRVVLDEDVTSNSFQLLFLAIMYWPSHPSTELVQIGGLLLEETGQSFEGIPSMRRIGIMLLRMTLSELTQNSHTVRLV